MAVVVVDLRGRVRFLNASAEQLFGLSRRHALGRRFAAHFVDAQPLERLLAEAAGGGFGEKTVDLSLARTGGEAQALIVSAVAGVDPAAPVLLEFRPQEQRRRVDRAERLIESTSAYRDLVRQLAHEIGNPLGGIRGAAQLLDAELETARLREYTGVIVKEADRLQSLVDRLLAPHRGRPRHARMNIHEVCEWVRSVVLAEYPAGLEILRDYDASLPELLADRERLVQGLLNLVRNAAQAMQGRGRIVLRTRIARQQTIARRRWKLALDLHVIDDGPGVPAAIAERVFDPLVSGREGGTGLGLTLAQDLVQQHGGIIEFDSRPGKTDFRIRLPLQEDRT
ncbi:MAG: nitrogen regulation protein NR(II) [Burkholderiaceae bacterium]|nr:nitrogen regulation protein NR(II) [Burkholderiaceae bacterium]